MTLYVAQLKRQKRGPAKVTSTDVLEYFLPTEVAVGAGRREYWGAVYRMRNSGLLSRKFVECEEGQVRPRLAASSERKAMTNKACPRFPLTTSIVDFSAEGRYSREPPSRYQGSWKQFASICSRPRSQSSTTPTSGCLLTLYLLFWLFLSANFTPRSRSASLLECSRGRSLPLTRAD